jgi:hypothetical protein
VTAASGFGSHTNHDPNEDNIKESCLHLRRGMMKNRYDNKNKRDLSLMEHHALKMGLAILTTFPFTKVGISIYCYISCNFIT